MSTEQIVVAALARTPVKGLRVNARPQVLLERGGVRFDRSFFLVDERGRMVNGKHLGALSSVTAEIDDGGRQLTLTFPAREVLTGPIERGQALEARFFSRSRQARLRLGPFSAALSEHAGQPLRLLAPAD